MNDHALICLMKDGNTEAFARVIDAYERPLIRFFYYATNDNEVAKDLTYDTFLAFFKQIRRFKQQSSLKNYLYAIGKNKLKDFYKRKKKNTYVSLEEIDTIGNEIFAFEVETEQSQDEFVQTMLSSLDKTARTIIEGFYKHSMSIKELAEKLKMTETNVKVKKKRILDSLQKKFIHHYDKTV